MSALEDQVLAGVLMWVLSTFVYAIAAMIITVQLLSPKKMRSLGQVTLDSNKNTDIFLADFQLAPGGETKDS